ncbi:MAG: ATP-binding protein, partial [Sphingobium sp.]|nr:ATP-binding protein [Sphingobium sp.]
MTQMPGAHQFANAASSAHPALGQAMGMVFQIAGSSSKVMIDATRLALLGQDPDPCTAMAGQVGSQVKMRVGQCWLVASVRAMTLDQASKSIIADIDFLGEGDEEQLTGRIYRFRRGVTRYPTPGTEIFPVSGSDMQQIYAADDRPNVEIGTVYPTNDTRAALYVDSMLGKHFALLGSTGTGKSTSAALILHRICDLSPQGHIVMIDPHGEYGAAFATNGAVFDINNLALPYWLMN